MNISQRIEIKPISVNECWQGRRFKTPKYKQYEKNLLKLLHKCFIPDAPYKLTIEVGFSNSMSDIDNIAKPFIDILQKKYLFNDKDILELHLFKKKVQKTKEYIKFSLITLD
jgi:Holliday junction resolvase RusA-like endonuclease